MLLRTWAKQGDEAADRGGSGESPDEERGGPVGHHSGDPPRKHDGEQGGQGPHRASEAAPSAWAAKAGFSLLTVNSALAIYRSGGDLASVLFISGSYTALLLLFRRLRDYERAPQGSPATERARRAVWPLTALLTLGFAWKVAAVMPSPAAAAAVWGLAVATTQGRRQGGAGAWLLWLSILY